MTRWIEVGKVSEVGEGEDGRDVEMFCEGHRRGSRRYPGTCVPTLQVAVTNPRFVRDFTTESFAVPLQKIELFQWDSRAWIYGNQDGSIDVACERPNSVAQSLPCFGKCNCWNTCQLRTRSLWIETVRTRRTAWVMVSPNKEATLTS